ncbi:MAG TPA: tRNA dihydrouridine synthase DusB [Pseudomonadales bacterium]|nr:tRNA dihydrouridine synthase DusB [Pseudomonadales bacterium]
MTSLNIGPYQIKTPSILAPMAGVTDLPFRSLCRLYGAGLAVSEMVSSDASLRDSRKSRLRICHDGEQSPRSVQIVGTDPAQLALAAQYNVEQGADIIDINMGCPAKKVCNKLAGSALLKDEKLVAEILNAVVKAVPVPVTLKIRTGWSPEQRNGVTIARIAEDAGIQALTVHGRTRACRFNGHAEYDTIAKISCGVRIPVIANGDIGSPEQAKHVMNQTGVACVMIGRGAQGRPWLFQEINHYIESGVLLSSPSLEEQRGVVLNHLDALYQLYGEENGLRIARKHVMWYTSSLLQDAVFRQTFNQLTDSEAQKQAVYHFYEPLIEQEISRV